MPGVCYKIPILMRHGSLKVVFPTRFSNEWKLDKTDYLLPCLEKNRNMKNDECIPDGYELIFKYRRKNNEKLFSFLDNLKGDNDE